MIVSIMISTAVAKVLFMSLHLLLLDLVYPSWMDPPTLKCIYDLEKMVGCPVIRNSEDGEQFTGIGNVNSTLAEGIPVLSDDEGIIHLYPYRDSVRTMITEDCTEALVVSCGVRGMRKKTVERALESVIHYWNQLKE